MQKTTYLPFEQNRPFSLVDTTLRDGEQTAGVIFSQEEKVHIAKLLDEIGVEQIEVGTPIMDAAEAKAIQTIVKAGLKASILGWNRAIIADVKASVACGVDAVEISCPISDAHIMGKLHSTRGKVLEDMEKTVEYAISQGCYVSVGAEDASRSQPAFLLQYAQTAKRAGAHRLRYCDTVGILGPMEVFTQIQQLRQQVDLPIEIHCHNDFGMATANTFAALQAGATFLGATILGLGERAGNAALEEIILGLKQVYGHPIPYTLGKLKETCHYVAQAAGQVISPAKPIVGANIFTHESGIHVHGVLKDSALYEAFDPALIGLERRIVLGKHSGTAAVLYKLNALGLGVDEAFAAQLLPEVRALTITLKRPPTDQEILALVKKQQGSPA
jgi:homocitrate synthase NifV